MPHVFFRPCKLGPRPSLHLSSALKIAVHPFGDAGTYPERRSYTPACSLTSSSAMRVAVLCVRNWHHRPEMIKEWVAPLTQTAVWSWVAHHVSFGLLFHAKIAVQIAELHAHHCEGSSSMALKCWCDQVSHMIDGLSTLAGTSLSSSCRIKLIPSLDVLPLDLLTYR